MGPQVKKEKGESQDYKALLDCQALLDFQAQLLLGRQEYLGLRAPQVQRVLMAFQGQRASLGQKASKVIEVIEVPWDCLVYQGQQDQKEKGAIRETWEFQDQRDHGDYLVH